MTQNINKLNLVRYTICPQIGSIDDDLHMHSMRAIRSVYLVRNYLRPAQRIHASYAGYTHPHEIGILGVRCLSTPSNPSPIPPPDATTATSSLTDPVNRLLEPIGVGAQSVAADGNSIPADTPLATNSGSANTTALPMEKVYIDASDTMVFGASTSAPETIANGTEVIGVGSETISNTADAGTGAVVDVVGGVDPSVVAQAAEQAVLYSAWSETLLTPTYWILNTMHDSTGLAWWSTIAVSTIIVRSVLVPVTVKIMQNSAKLVAMRPEMKARQDKIMELYKSGQQTKAQKMMKENQDFMTGAGVNPLKVLMGPLMQIPIFLSFFVAIRRLAVTEPTFATGGMAWFVDLSLRDPYFIMPIMCGASLFAMFEYGSDGQSSEMMTPIMKTMMRFMAVGSVFATYWFPAAVFCYWLPNNIFSLGFNLIAKSKPMKKTLNLDVNLADIPGTKEFMRAKRFSHLTPPLSDQQLDSASAAVTQLRNRQSTDVKEKPKFFINRPKKSKKKACL